MVLDERLGGLGTDDVRDEGGPEDEQNKELEAAK